MSPRKDKKMKIQKTITIERSLVNTINGYDSNFSKSLESYINELSVAASVLEDIKQECYNSSHDNDTKMAVIKSILTASKLY